MKRSYLDYPVEVTELNPGGPRLIVLLHGFGASTFSWRTVTGSLATLGHVLAYDRPGFGFTPLVDRTGGLDPYSLAGQVELLHKIIDAESKGRPVFVVGHSAGGLVAAAFALKYPDALAGLILESPAIWRKAPVPASVAKLLRNPRVEAFGDSMLKSFDKAGTKMLTDSFFDAHNLTPFVMKGYRAPMEQATWRTSLWRFMTADQANDVRENLGNIKPPVFVLTGDSDKIVKVQDTFKVTERIPGHKIYMVPNSGHLAHEEQPDDWIRVVRNFIERVTPNA
jgi:pimeloyl-ACP methyl ester carboxylesterase